MFPYYFFFLLTPSTATPGCAQLMNSGYDLIDPQYCGRSAGPSRLLAHALPQPQFWCQPLEKSLISLLKICQAAWSLDVNTLIQPPATDTTTCIRFFPAKSRIVMEGAKEPNSVKAIHRGLALRDIFTAKLPSQSCPKCLRPNTARIPAQLEQAQQEHCTAGCCEDERLPEKHHSPKASCWSIPCSLESGLYPNHTGRMHLHLLLSLHSDFKRSSKYIWHDNEGIKKKISYF